MKDKNSPGKCKNKGDNIGKIEIKKRLFVVLYRIF